MKVIWLSCKVLSGVLCCILVFPRADSSQIYDGVQGSSEELNSYQNPLYGRVIAPEAARATSTDAFDEVLRKISQVGPFGGQYALITFFSAALHPA